MQYSFLQRLVPIFSGLEQIHTFTETTQGKALISNWMFWYKRETHLIQMSNVLPRNVTLLSNFHRWNSFLLVMMNNKINILQVPDYKTSLECRPCDRPCSQEFLKKVKETYGGNSGDISTARVFFWKPLSQAISLICCLLTTERFLEINLRGWCIQYWVLCYSCTLKVDKFSKI